MTQLIDLFVHVDKHIVTIVNIFGVWTYGILFLIIFIETGAVILPFLPGDSLLFAAAALAANPEYHLNIWIFMILFLIAAITGDSINFLIGSKLGKNLPKYQLFDRLISQKNLNNARDFFNKHGPIAIFLARFMPIIRTFAPFVAATSNYCYKSFLKYNIVAGTSWVIICCSGGFFFGNMPYVKTHFSLIIIGIILVSLIPVFIGLIKDHRHTS